MISQVNQISFCHSFDSLLLGNSPPETRPIELQSAVQGLRMHLSLADYFTDRDGDQLVFSLQDLPSGTGFGIENGVLFGTPTATDAAQPQPLAFLVVVQDGHGGQAESSIKINVQGKIILVLFICW